MPPQLVGIFFAGCGNLVDETFQEKSILGRADRSPESYGDARVCQLIINKNIRNCVRNAVTDFHASPVEIVLQRPEPGHQGWASDAVYPHDGPPISVEAGGEVRMGSGAIIIVLYVVFPRPGYFGGRAYRLGNFHRFGDKIGLEA